MSWTDERVTLLKQLWGEGKTAADIAKILGGISRNAVIGKVHRLKLSSRVSPVQQNLPVKVKVETVAIARAVKQAVRAPEFRGRGVKMFDLDNRMCRWPNGDPKDESFSFCGCEGVPGLPYCPEHARLAYQVSTRSRTLVAADFDNQAGTPTDFDIKHVSNG